MKTFFGFYPSRWALLERTNDGVACLSKAIAQSDGSVPAGLNW
ncbi:hypothetical protein [Leptolyngbya sp. BC1307]|nr:hypothetical protein [Leptolyngbya sp. BC1307]